MIKRFIRRVLGLPSDAASRVPREKHGLAREAISPAAAKVCAVLREAGFTAYVVGGAVRDLLLGIVRRTSTSRPTRGPSRSSRSSGARWSSAGAFAWCT